MSEKLSVMILCTNSDLSGAPIHVETLVNSLSGEVDFVLVFGSDGPISKRLEAKGFRVHILLGMESSVRPIRDFFVLLKLLKIIRENQPQILHCHSSKAGMLGRLAGWISSVPVIFTIHGWSWFGLRGLLAKISFIFERCLSNFSGVHYIYVCGEMQMIGRKKLKIPSERGAVIFNGIEDINLASSKRVGPVNFLMPARVSRQKDHRTLLLAFEKMPTSSNLVLCGTDTDTENFFEFSRSIAPRRTNSVVFLGARDDVPRLLSKADVLVLISHWEALPISIIEGMRAGLPIIASDVGGNNELVLHGVSGLLVSPRSVNELADAMEQLQDPVLRHNMGIAGRARFEEKFKSEVMARETLGIYRGMSLN